MIVNDTERQIKVGAGDARAEQLDNFLHLSQQEVRDHIHVARIQDQSKFGRPMWPKEFEDRLSRLNASFIFEVIDQNPTKKRLSIEKLTGKKFIAVYENTLMPERSIPKLREMEVPDPNWDHSKTSRLDISPDEKALKPGWRRLTIPWGEYKRGWRTVLVRLIQEGHITVTQAETEFGSDDTPEWRQHTGKGAYTTPF